MTANASIRGADLNDRGREIFVGQLTDLRRRADRLFIVLMLLQWLAAVVAALLISPRTWAGTYSETHVHVWVALVLGGVLAALPVAMACLWPGVPLTRYVIAVSQMLWSALLIHLTGGRIETHFHVFGSLALLAWYRDPWLLLAATGVVGVDHFLRGLWFSQSVYGVAASTPWRSVEHACWVLFEDVFLWISMRHSLRSMKELADSHAALGIDHDLARAEVRKQTKELHGAEERLRQAQKMEAVGQLAGGVAHDFNNLLTIIGGYSEMLLCQTDPSARSFGAINEIKGAADRAASLTRQLLAFSRKQILAPKLVNLNVVVTDMNKMLQRLIGEDIELVTVQSQRLGRILVDPGQIEQVIVNLAVNARDAMPEGGKLTIETANVDLAAADLIRQENGLLGEPDLRTDRFVLLSVSDTGCGMDEEIKAHMFEPFFTTKEVGKGTGLGLATVYGIVKQSGGAVTVYSEMGHGSTFKVYLPWAAADDKVEHTVRPAPPPGGTETVLLVEDEEKVRDMTRAILEGAGYRVLEAKDGLDALEVAQRHGDPLDVLLSDVVMPKLGGRRLVERLRPAYPHVAVLYMSGYTDDAVVRHGILEAEAAFIQKPFSPNALLTKIREVLDAPKRRPVGEPDALCPV